jgi:hypothetical protein
MSTMRLVALCLLALFVAAPASAATPRFGFFDLGADVAKASKNVYGDVRIATSRDALERRAPDATIVHCAAECRLGTGWLAFAKPSRLTLRDLGPARAHPGLRGWSLSVELSARGRTAWKRVAAAIKQQTARSGLPPVYAVVLDGTILATPYANELRLKGSTLELTGFEKAAAKRAARLLP